MKLRIESKYLVCKLTSEERIEKGKELAKLCQDINDKEALEAERRKEAKNTIEYMEAQRDSLLAVVQTGEEKRNIEVRLDLDGNKVNEIRLDTGEIVITRPATKEEMQQKLSLEVEETVNRP